MLSTTGQAVLPKIDFHVSAPCHGYWHCMTAPTTQSRSRRDSVLKSARRHHVCDFAWLGTPAEGRTAYDLLRPEGAETKSRGRGRCSA